MQGGDQASSSHPASQADNFSFPSTSDLEASTSDTSLRYSSARGQQIFDELATSVGAFFASASMQGSAIQQLEEDSAVLQQEADEELSEVRDNASQVCASSLNF